MPNSDCLDQRNGEREREREREREGERERWRDEKVFIVMITGIN